MRSQRGVDGREEEGTGLGRNLGESRGASPTAGRFQCGRTLPALHRGWRPRLLLWRPAVATASASGAERSHAV